MKLPNFDSLYLFSLHVTYVNFYFTQTGHRHSLVFVTGNWTGNGRRQFKQVFSVVYCVLMISDTLINILNLVCQILPRPLCLDELKAHKKRFIPVHFLRNGVLTHMSWAPGVA